MVNSVTAHACCRSPFLNLDFNASGSFKVHVSVPRRSFACDFFRNLIIFDRPKVIDRALVEMNSELGSSVALCKRKRPDDYV